MRLVCMACPLDLSKLIRCPRPGWYVRDSTTDGTIRMTQLVPLSDEHDMPMKSAGVGRQACSQNRARYTICCPDYSQAYILDPPG